MTAGSIRDIESERILAGIGLVVVATACFAGIDTTTKLSTAFIPILLAIWARFTFQAVALSVTLLPRRGLNLLKTRHPLYQLLRGLLMFTSTSLAFVTLRWNTHQS